MDGCVGARVLEQGDNEMVASLTLSKAGSRPSPLAIFCILREDRAAAGGWPFKRLHGVWSFKPLADNACKVSLELSFEFSNILVNIASSSLLAHVANHMVDAFSRRATAVMGNRMTEHAMITVEWRMPCRTSNVLWSRCRTEPQRWKYSSRASAPVSRD